MKRATPRVELWRQLSNGRWLIVRRFRFWPAALRYVGLRPFLDSTPAAVIRFVPGRRYVVWMFGNEPTRILRIAPTPAIPPALPSPRSHHAARH